MKTLESESHAEAGARVAFFIAHLDQDVDTLP
jgi:hypothetical protein